MRPRHLLAIVAAMLTSGALADDMVAVGSFAIDRTEVTVGQFAQFAAETGFVSKAERDGGGLVYAAGWEQMPGWTWASPFGAPADPLEPAVHLTFDEAQAYCAWAGKRLPRQSEWTLAAYTEHRSNPPAPFAAGTTYPYPTGERPLGANCLEECGDPPALDRSHALMRGIGPARAGSTQPGVNGLFDMGANVWEWVATGPQRADQGTMGGSWWYGAHQMHRDHRASKPRDMAVVYIGFRCVRDLD